MPTKTDYLKLACEARDVAVDSVLAHKLTETEIILVVRNGQKYTVPLAELNAEAEAKKVDKLKGRRVRKKKVDDDTDNDIRDSGQKPDASPAVK